MRHKIDSEKEPLKATDDPFSHDLWTGFLDDEATRKRIMREMGSRGGKKGGKARAAVLKPEQRQDIARKAAEARWRRK